MISPSPASNIIRPGTLAQFVPWPALAPCSWTLQESQVESCEHQDDPNIRRQTFPESVSEEHEIRADYDSHHRRHVKHDSYLSAHSDPAQSQSIMSSCHPILQS